MRKLIAVFLALFIFTGCASTNNTQDLNGTYSFTDDTGAVITVDGKPKKVAVLLSSLADLWITAGGKIDVTVGESVERGIVSNEVTLVDDGAGKTVNTEILIASKPDFVIYSSDIAGQIECAEILKNAGITAAGFNIESFSDYIRVLKISTDILCEPKRYEKYGIKLQEEISHMLSIVKKQSQNIDLLFVRAGSSAKVTKAKTATNNFVCAMLKELGTYNIAEKASILLDGISTEEVLVLNPDFIFYTTMGSESAAVSYMDSLVSDPIWQNLDAVKSDRVYCLPKELFQYKPNSRWAEAYKYLINLLYGDIL